MELKTDIEIAQSIELEEIVSIAAKLEIPAKHIENYGRYKAKIDYSLLNELETKKDGKLVLVTAITPTPAGEGKTTNTIGIGDALTLLGKKTVIALREPSLGPVFGVKGGAAGGGYAQVVPMEDINLHFTGDIHAVGAANNLLAALIDNHIQQGNELNIDPRRISWKRAMDMNDRQLRYIIDGLQGRVNGVPREDGFEITVASEIMAILCLALDLADLKERLARIVIGYNYADEPVTAGDLQAARALAVLLKDALKPNLVQSLAGTPAFVHGGPFANIAHGCNSIMATKTALKLADYVVTEAGFGADLGAEKFLDIKCRMGGFSPDAVVIVASIRALKHHGGVEKNKLGQEDLVALEKGMPNLLQHIDNIRNVFGLPAVVSINRFPTDTEAELDLVLAKCEELGVSAEVSEVWAKGGEGGLALAKEIIRLAENEKEEFRFAYESEQSLRKKIEAVVSKVYRGAGIQLSTAAEAELRRLEENGYGHLPVCLAKTQYSFSDDPTKYGAPEGFVVNIGKTRVSAGAGFVVVLTGDIMTMPGLPKKPAALSIDINNEGKISGLF